MKRNPRPAARRPSRWIAALVGVALAALSTATAATAASGPTPSPAPAGPSSGAKKPPSTFGIGPANATKLDGRPYFTFAVSPGATITDHVAVENLSDIPLKLGVYATNVLNNNAGDFAFASFGTKVSDAGAWIKLVLPAGKDSITIPARTTAILPVELALPANASPGDHSAGIVADLTVGVTANKGQSPAGIGATLHQRVGVRVFIRVAGQIRPGLKIEDLHATYHGTLNPTGRGYSTVSYTVHNVGNVNLGATQSVEVHGLLGATAKAKGLADISLLLPGSSVKETVRVDGVFPELHETATVRLHPEHLSSDVDPGLTNYTASTGFWAVPWTLLAIVALLVASFWGRRRRARRPGAVRTASHAPATAGLDLQEVR